MGISSLGRLSATGTLGQLDDAALDGVHQREIAHGPGEQRSFDVAGAAQEERGGGEIHHPGQAELAIHRLQTIDPQPCGLAVLFRLLAVVALELFFVCLTRLSRDSSGAPRR